MGNRAYIVINDPDVPEATISLYGHYSGEDNLTAVRAVLDRTDRLGDHSYLTAQLFYEFASIGWYDGEIGFGIMAGDMSDDSDNPTVYVNSKTGGYIYKDEFVSEFVKGRHL